MEHCLMAGSTVAHSAATKAHLKAEHSAEMMAADLADHSAAMKAHKKAEH